MIVGKSDMQLGVRRQTLSLISVSWSLILLCLQIYLNFSSRVPVMPRGREESSTHSTASQHFNSAGNHSPPSRPLLLHHEVFLEGTEPFRVQRVWGPDPTMCVCLIKCLWPSTAPTPPSPTATTLVSAAPRTANNLLHKRTTQKAFQSNCHSCCLLTTGRTVGLMSSFLEKNCLGTQEGGTYSTDENIITLLPFFCLISPFPCPTHFINVFLLWLFVFFCTPHTLYMTVSF